MDTNLSLTEIELLLVECPFFNTGQDIFVPNVSFGLLNHEADLVVMTKAGYLSEIEIKRSWADFLADFKKSHAHKDERIYKFYYAVPEAIAEKVMSHIRVNSLPTNGVIIYHEDGKVSFHAGSTMGVYYSGGRKLFLEEQLTLVRLGCKRIWNLKRKLLQATQPPLTINE